MPGLGPTMVLSVAPAVFPHAAAPMTSTTAEEARRQAQPGTANPFSDGDGPLTTSAILRQPLPNRRFVSSSVRSIPLVEDDMRGANATRVPDGVRSPRIERGR